MRVPVGNEVKFRVTFKNAAGVVADPTAVTFKIKPPTGALVTKVYGVDVDLVKEAVGIYSITYLLSEALTWRARFEGTGSVRATSADIAVEVDPTVVA